VFFSPAPRDRRAAPSRQPPAWLEDNRRLDNGTLAHRALGLALRHPISRQWKGIGSGAFRRRIPMVDFYGKFMEFLALALSEKTIYISDKMDRVNG
jgi:hypothetical protein